LWRRPPNAQRGLAAVGAWWRRGTRPRSTFLGATKGRRELGWGGDGTSLGFFIHPLIAIDADDETVPK
jgi:hypothetical protein